MKKTSTQIKKNSRLLFLVALLLTGTNQLLAQKFGVQNADGKMIYYNQTSQNTVEVTYKQIPMDTTAYTDSISIPETVLHDGVTYNVTAIGYRAFDSCFKLTSVTIPNSVTSIGALACYNCRRLETINIPNGVTLIKDSTFYGCTRLSSITIPDGITSIGIRAFISCVNLKSLIIPNSVTSINYGAFYGAKGLDSISLGSGLDTIGGQAFANCYNIITIRSYSKLPPYILSTTFNSVNRGIPVYIPANSINMYKCALYWNEFIDFRDPANIGIEDDAIQQIVVRGIVGAIMLNATEDRMVRIYNVQGNLIWQGIANNEQRVDVPNSGLYLVAIEGIPTQKVVVMK